MSTPTIEQRVRAQQTATAQAKYDPHRITADELRTILTELESFRKLQSLPCQDHAAYVPNVAVSTATDPVALRHPNRPNSTSQT